MGPLMQIIQRRADLPCVEHGSVCRGDQPRDRQVWLVERRIGPGKLLDTDRFYHLLEYSGRLHGHNGPKVNPETDKVWGLDFPVITIRDMVNAQAGFSTIWEWRHCSLP